MANTLTNFLGKVVAGVLPVLRQNARTPRTVNRNYNITSANRGDVINVPISAAQTASAVTPGPVPPTPADKAPTVVQIPLDQWFFTDFHLTDQEITRINAEDGWIPGQTAEAIKAIANKIDSTVLDCYKSVYNFAGTAGTTPFASAAAVWSGPTGISKLMDDGLTPPDDRYVMLNTAANANARSLAPFQSAEQRGSAETIRSGNVGYVLGADWYMNQNLPNHVAGTSTGGNATTTAGSASVTVAAGGASGTFKKGDLITIATLSGQYTVTADVTLSGGGGGTIVVSPVAAASVTTQAITYIGNHAVNLAYHRDAFALATAIPKDITIPGLNGESLGSLTVVDPVTGMAIRLQVIREWMQTAFVFDALWGVGCPRGGVNAGRILG